MPYDYPGEYAARFDGVDDGPAITFERLSAPTLVHGLKSTPTGMLTLHGVKGASPRGTMLLEQWYRASGAGGGPSKNLTIEVTRAAQSPERWHVVAAVPRKWVLRAGTAGAAPAPISVESLELSHLGVRRV